MKSYLNLLGIFIGATGGIEVIHQFPIDEFVKVVSQAVIAVFAIIAFFKKKKEQ